jgi:hypothetical protein
MNPAEVQRYGDSSNSSGRRKSSQSRALDITSKEWNLVHEPTGTPQGSTLQATRQRND